MITARPQDATDPPGATSAVSWGAQGLESLFDDRKYAGPHCDGQVDPDDKANQPTALADLASFAA